jgi:DNA polymerase-1
MPSISFFSNVSVDSLVNSSAIDTLLSNFIVPLQSDDISKPNHTGVYRVHCSLNINTETGRLSARRPNLQNQPALEKDRYKVRKAFTADVAAGRTLIVADYGQLELRILAHMAKCKSMIEAFKLGGDFHSRTALGMYDYIQDAIQKGDCLLEWDGGLDNPPPAPLLKDMFANERRKAKVLNFSIAYGKTAHGLSKDWAVSLKEAEETVRRWYSDRPEVETWQAARREQAEREGYVGTLLGRRRNLPDARSKKQAVKAHALRAAINTPIQGSAADVATAAMLRINANEELRELGWRLLLQVHDEVILEGPQESAERAERIVVDCMRSPFSGAIANPLLVELAVDSKHATTWYDAK